MKRHVLPWKVPVVLLCLLMVVSIGFMGCGTKTVDTSKETYKVGAVLSLSGPAAPLGTPEHQALMMLEEQLNAGEGIDGHGVEFIFEDDESDSAKAAITKLITQDEVAAVIGSSSTGATLAMAPIAGSNKVTQVCCAAGTKITDPVQKYVFRTPPTDSMAIDRVLNYLNDANIKKIAILHDANAFGTGGADELSKKAPTKGVTVVARESYGSTDTDMTAQLTKIKETPAEAVVVWGTNPGPAWSIAKNMQQLGMTIPFIGSHGIANKKFIELAGSAANGVVFPAGRMLIPSSIPAGSDWRQVVDTFVTDFKAKYNADADTFAGHGWDAGRIITEAMKTAGTDTAALRNAIEETNGLVGIGGIFTFSPTNHDGLKVSDLIMIKIDNGAWTEETTSK